MTGQLIFNLPEDQEEFVMAQQAGAFKSVLQQFDNYLRGRLKYEELPEEVREHLQAARDKLYAECIDHNISIWD